MAIVTTDARGVAALGASVAVLGGGVGGGAVAGAAAVAGATAAAGAALEDDEGAAAEAAGWTTGHAGVGLGGSWLIAVSTEQHK